MFSKRVLEKLALFFKNFTFWNTPFLGRQICHEDNLKDLFANNRKKMLENDGKRENDVILKIIQETFQADLRSIEQFYLSKLKTDFDTTQNCNFFYLTRECRNCNHSFSIIVSLQLQTVCVRRS